MFFHSFLFKTLKVDIHNKIFHKLFTGTYFHLQHLQVNHVCPSPYTITQQQLLIFKAHCRNPLFHKRHHHRQLQTTLLRFFIQLAGSYHALVITYKYNLLTNLDFLQRHTLIDRNLLSNMQIIT